MPVYRIKKGSLAGHMSGEMIMLTEVQAARYPKSLELVQGVDFNINPVDDLRDNKRENVVSGTSTKTNATANTVANSLESLSKSELIALRKRERAKELGGDADLLEAIRIRLKFLKDAEVEPESVDTGEGSEENES